MLVGIDLGAYFLWLIVTLSVFWNWRRPVQRCSARRRPNDVA